tara:strand:- start:6425 stop:7747 length:1323 start_codon:yes stop_codon:yes gene_type:complete
MTQQIKQVCTVLFILLPIFLITGPAVPDIIITLTGIIFLIFVFLKKFNLDLKNNHFLQITVFFWVSLLIISIFAIDKLKSFQDSIIFLRFLIIPLSCYFLFFKEMKNLNYLLIIIFILVIFVCLDTLYQFFNYSPENGFGTDILGFKSSWYGRLTGPFGEELIPGSYVSKFGLAGYVLLLINDNLRKKYMIHIFYLSLILIVCFISGERMAFATYSLALMMLVLFLKNNRLVIFLSIIVGTIIIFSFFKLHPFYNDYKVLESNQYHQGLKIEKSYKCEDDNDKICTKIIQIQPTFLQILKNFSTSAYGEIYLLSIEMFKDNPITGIGINNFKYLCEKKQYYRELMVNYNCASHPHNTYIQWLTEGGLIIFFIFLMYLIILCNLIYRNNGDREYKVISLVLLLILFWPIMSTGSLVKNWYGISVFFIIAISMCISRIKKSI